MVMKKDSGFTLIEMMVVLAVASVLLGVGIPKLSVFFQNGRMTTNTNALVAAFQIAKSEAIKRQGPVTVCRSASAASCDSTDAVNTCTCDLDAANTWEDGFIVFFDPGADGVVNGVVDSGDIILRINAGAENRVNTDTDPVTGDVTIRSSSTAQNEHQYITFNSRGHPKNGTALQSATYKICDNRQNADGTLVEVTVNGVSKTTARGVVLSVSGKVRSTRDASKIASCI